MLKKAKEAPRFKLFLLPLRLHLRRAVACIILRMPIAEFSHDMKPLQAKLAKYTVPQEAKAAGIYPYFRAISSEQDPEVIINGRRVLMFGSNCYTGLVNDPRIKEAAIEATRKYGTGCAGSPFLNGTLDLHKQLEARIAEYIGKEDVMIYSTGFGVNLGVVSTLTGREDYILWDEQDHASIIEGRRLSFSQSLKYKHNDMESLEKQLQRCEPDKIKLIVTDGVFSMEGDVANLPKIVELAKKYNATVMVDEAHSIGVFGEGGRGICNHYGLTDDVDLVMGTFSKSFASLGGFIATDKEITNFLRHHSRSYIFTASITPASTAAALKAIDLMIEEPERQENLWKHFHADYPPVYTRQLQDFRHNARSFRPRNIRESRGIARGGSSRHPHTLQPYGHAHRGTGGRSARENNQCI